MSNDGIRGFALNMLQSRLSVAQRNNPQAQIMINAIQNNDQVTGEEIADNICRSLGLTREEAVQQALNSFGIK